MLPGCSTPSVRPSENRCSAVCSDGRVVFYFLILFPDPTSSSSLDSFLPACYCSTDSLCDSVTPKHVERCPNDLEKWMPRSVDRRERTYTHTKQKPSRRVSNKCSASGYISTKLSPMASIKKLFEESGSSVHFWNLRMCLNMCAERRLEHFLHARLRFRAPANTKSSALAPKSNQIKYRDEMPL